MLAHQAKLPRLPVPTLESTVEGFLDAARPLLAGEPQVLRATEAAARELLGPAGRALQDRLLARAADPKVDNWLEEWWHDAYVSDRGPIPTHVSPAFVWGPDPRGCNSQVPRAAKMITAALRMRAQIDDGTYPPDMSRGAPFCMAEYARQFAVVRTPGRERDVLVSYRDQRPTHVVVLTGGRLYSVEVCEKDGAPLPPRVIATALQAAKDDACSQGRPELCAPVLTSWRRSEWAAAREKIRASEAGRRAIEQVESAIFCVALDSCCPEAQSGATGKHFMHGAGGDRWFDKCFNLIVCANGVAGLVFEHTGTDALPPLRLADYVFEDAGDYPEGKVAPGGPGANGAQEIVIPLNGVEDDVRAAERHFAQQVALVDLEWLNLPEYGFPKIKAFSGISPDAFVQLALQLAWRRARGLPPPSTYEAGNMKMYLHGRTETVRPVTPESVAFCDRFEDGAADAAARERALRAAVGGHLRALKRVKDGRGVDRHLLGLRILAAQDGAGKAPALFNDPGFKRFAAIALSTSNPQGSTFPGAVLDAVFGPVTPTGIGACYLIHADRLVIMFTSFTQEAPRFAECFKSACADMMEALRCGAPPAKL